MGRNAAERLKDGGIDAKKSGLIHVPVADIWAPPKGHPLYHPRFGDPVDRSMVDDIRERGVEKPIKVRDDGAPPGEKRKLLLVDGGRRTRNALVAQEELGQTLYVPIEFFNGTDADVLIERIRSNADPLKKPDKASVLALTIAQLLKLGPLDTRAVAAVMPKGIGPAEVEALARWGNLTKEARERFDDGAPIGLLAAVLDAPRDAQVATLDKLIAAGVKSTRGATRHTNGARDAKDPWARRMSPKAQVRMADTLTKRNTKLRGGEATLQQGIVIGLYLAANADVEQVLSEVPPSIADAIREARAAKKGRAK